MRPAMLLYRRTLKSHGVIAVALMRRARGKRVPLFDGA
jgi:hypothetical protein